MNKIELIANEKLGFIKNLMKTAIEEKLKANSGIAIVISSAYNTMDSKVLKAILLNTGGAFTVIVNATVFNCNLVKKNLGVGVYNVWGVCKRVDTVKKIQLP